MSKIEQEFDKSRATLDEMKAQFYKEDARSIDIHNCPTIRRCGRGLTSCRCTPKCLCGYGPHAGVHGPVYGQPVGSTPWNHEYVPR